MCTKLSATIRPSVARAGSTSANWGFALALTFGVITGTYSSIFVASPIVVWWQGWVSKKREEMRKSRGAKKTRARNAQ